MKGYTFCFRVTCLSNVYFNFMSGASVFPEVSLLSIFNSFIVCASEYIYFNVNTLCSILAIVAGVAIAAVVVATIVVYLKNHKR